MTGQYRGIRGALKAVEQTGRTLDRPRGSLGTAAAIILGRDSRLGN